MCRGMVFGYRMVFLAMVSIRHMAEDVDDKVMEFFEKKFSEIKELKEENKKLKEKVELLEEKCEVYKKTISSLKESIAAHEELRWALTLKIRELERQHWRSQ